jgi:hypothetical protein
MQILGMRLNYAIWIVGRRLNHVMQILTNHVMQILTNHSMQILGRKLNHAMCI